MSLRWLTTQIRNFFLMSRHAASPMTSPTLCCEKLWYFNKESRKHNLTFFTTSLNISLVPVGSACFFLFIFDDNFVPALFHTPALPLRWHWQHCQTNAAVFCETHRSMVTALLAFGFSGHLDLKKLPVGTICQPPATLFILFWQVVLMLPGSLAAFAGCAGYKLQHHF